MTGVKPRVNELSPDSCTKVFLNALNRIGPAPTGHLGSNKYNSTHPGHTGDGHGQELGLTVKQPFMASLAPNVLEFENKSVNNSRNSSSLLAEKGTPKKVDEILKTNSYNKENSQARKSESFHSPVKDIKRYMKRKRNKNVRKHNYTTLKNDDMSTKKDSNLKQKIYEELLLVNAKRDKTFQDTFSWPSSNLPVGFYTVKKHSSERSEEPITSLSTNRRLSTQERPYYITADRKYSSQGSKKKHAYKEIEQKLRGRDNIMEGKVLLRTKKRKHKLEHATKGYVEDNFDDIDKNIPNKLSSESIESFLSTNETEDLSNWQVGRQGRTAGLLRYPESKESSKNRLHPKTEDLEKLAPHSIATQLSKLKNHFKNARIEQEVIGRTVQYNDIVLWKIKECRGEERRSNFRANNKIKYSDEPPEKKIIFIIHGLTVMGWNGLDCLNVVKRFKTLVGYYLENLDSFDIFLIPMANPDGVAKIIASDPDDYGLTVKWNKNNSPQSACPGVNVDRNFDVAWNASTEKINSCNQNYPGTKPFSENESKAIRDVFFKYGHKMVAYIHVHAGTYDATVLKGDAVLYPPGMLEHPTEDDKYIDLKGIIDETMRNTSFKHLSVSVDTLHNWYGPIKGSSVDWTSMIYGVPYALEFVMQVYGEDLLDEGKVPDDQREKHTALTEVWQLLIDAIFDGMYRSVVKPNERR